jgi:hypothetical protein
LFGDPSTAQTISNVNLDLLDTMIGINIEGDFADQGINTSENIVNKDVPMFRFFFKAGWGCQPIRKRSEVSAKIGAVELMKEDIILGNDFKNYAYFIAGIRRKFNSHWDLVGTWRGSFSKTFKSNLVAIGIGYHF